VSAPRPCPSASRSAQTDYSQRNDRAANEYDRQSTMALRRDAIGVINARAESASNIMPILESIAEPFETEPGSVVLRIAARDMAVTGIEGMIASALSRIRRSCPSDLAACKNSPGLCAMLQAHRARGAGHSLTRALSGAGRLAPVDYAATGQHEYYSLLVRYHRLKARPR